jgi:hypothetical protein
MHWRACTLWVRSVHARKKPPQIAVGNYPRPPVSPDGCCGGRICLDLSRALPEHGQASLDVRSSRALPVAGCDRARPPKAIASMPALRTQIEPQAPGYVLSHLQRHLRCKSAARLASRTHAAITLDHTAAESAPRAVGTALKSSADRRLAVPLRCSCKPSHRLLAPLEPQHRLRRHTKSSKSPVFIVCAGSDSNRRGVTPKRL